MVVVTHLIPVTIDVTMMVYVDDTDLEKDPEGQKLLPRREKKDKYGI